MKSFLILLRSYLFAKRFFVFKFLKISIIFDIQKFSLTKINCLEDHDLFTLVDIFHYEVYGLKLDWVSEKLHEKKNNRKMSILDIGANIGASSIYFLKQFPDSKLVAIEASHRNYQILQKNLKKFKNKTILNNAISIQDEILLKESFHSNADRLLNPNELKENPQIKESLKSVKKISCQEIEEILKESFFGILKIDIEGAEDVFFDEYESVASKFQIIQVEVHDWMNLKETANSKSLLKFLSKNDYKIILQRDVIHCIKN